MKNILMCHVKAFLIFTTLITASMGFSVTNGILTLDNLKESSAAIDIVNLQGKRVFKQTISSSNSGIDVRSILVKNGRSPLVIRLTVNGKTTNTIVTLVANDRITFKGDLPAITQQSTLVNTSGSLDNNFEVINGVVREGTLDGNPIEFVDYGDKWIYDGDILIGPPSDENNVLLKTDGAGRTNSGAKWSNR